MIQRVALLAVTLLFAGACFAQTASAPAAPAPLTLAEYRHELASIHSQLDQAEHISKERARQLSGSLPLSFSVKDGEQEYSVPLYSVQDALAKAAAAEKDWEAARQQALSTIASLEREASAEPSPDYGVARQRASAILATKEFSSVHGPNWFDRLKAKIYDFFLRLLEGLFRKMAPREAMKYFIYGLAIIIVLIFGWWIWRMLPRSPEDAALHLSGAPISSKHWAEWMNEARAAAAQNAWREAVHLAYWGGISFLEAGGLWRPDRARTPREYLKLVPPNAPERPVLRDMTREFERAWYAQQQADSTDFTRMIAHLEALGCR